MPPCKRGRVPVRSLLLLASDPMRWEEGSESVPAYSGSDFTRTDSNRRTAINGCQALISMENKIECALPEVWRRKFQQSVDVCSKAIIPQAEKPTHIRIINCIGVKSDGSESTEFLYELAKMKATSVAVLYQNWRLMSTECQTGSLLPPVARSRVPWIFVPTADGAIFANFMGKRSLCATNGDMPHASLVYSRDGWLLFLSLSGEEKCDCQMVLMNPFSSETFTMPPAPLGLRCATPKASFTVREGRPDLVIYSCWVGRRNIQALLARPGEDEWQVHTASVLSQYIGLCDPLLCAWKLYCVFDSGCRLMVFHLDGQYWSSYSVYLRGPYLVEFEGKVLSVCAPKPFEPDGGGKFFVGELTVGENQAALVKLDDSELSNKSWFLGPVQSFCARMKGQRVYEFAYKPQWDGEDIGKKHYHVHYHDLLKKKFRYLS